ncbi:hypothetical protein [Capybara microvirus Cap3_SP_320]|nr:hypothetical protein [Capybara microvirus Cap3_SP_320]
MTKHLYVLVNKLEDRIDTSFCAKNDAVCLRDNSTVISRIYPHFEDDCVIFRVADIVLSDGQITVTPTPAVALEWDSSYVDESPVTSLTPSQVQELLKKIPDRNTSPVR